jgi:ferritin heavy chain
MMLRVSPSRAAASANQPAAASFAARTSVTMAAPHPFGTTCRAAAKGKEVLSGVAFQPFEELKGIGTVVYLLLLFCAGAC